MQQGLLLAGVGVAVGLAAALAANRLTRSLLFGVEPTDVPTLAAVTSTIVLAGALACRLPAWRASRLDPMTALRDE
jgi:ABC-type antimicrobial peptide transport system permease subunit